MKCWALHRTFHFKGGLQIHHVLLATFRPLPTPRAFHFPSIEWGGTGQLGSTGVARDSLKAGDVVVITGAPVRNVADHRIRLVILKRPEDCFTWGGQPDETVD